MKKDRMGTLVKMFISLPLKKIPNKKIVKETNSISLHFARSVTTIILSFFKK